MAKQFDYNALFASEFTGLKGQIEVLTEVLNVMDWALESALGELEEKGHLSAEASLLREYRSAIKLLRQRGFRRPKVEGESVTCPGCKAVLRDVSGAAGERCSWCGYEFG